MIHSKGFFDPETHTVSYLVWDADSRDAVIIDPVLDFDPASARTETRSADAILDDVRRKELSVKGILETHPHADHLSSAAYIQTQTNAPIGIGARIADVQTTFKGMFQAHDVSASGQEFDYLLSDDEDINFGTIPVRVMHTLGHTSSCVTYLIGNYAFVGDTLFMPDYGTARSDFPGGDAGTLYRSIQKILSLPKDTRVMVGHDYLPEGRDEHQWEASVAEHRARNIHVHDGISEKDFIALRTARDKTLTAPRLILPSLQVNIRAGHFPSQPDGQEYLIIPVNRI